MCDMLGLEVSRRMSSDVDTWLPMEFPIVRFQFFTLSRGPGAGCYCLVFPSCRYAFICLTDIGSRLKTWRVGGMYGTCVFSINIFFFGNAQ